jgi:hypothetical protein
MDSKTCKPGQEQWEEYHSSVYMRGDGRFVQYDYRTPSGELFSTIARTLEVARQRRDKWLADKEAH